MLVIRRRAGETVLIGNNVELEVLEIGSSQVKLGIRAPREVQVLRKEIQVTQEQNQAAAQGVPLQSLEKLRHVLGPKAGTESSLPQQKPAGG